MAGLLGGGSPQGGGLLGGADMSELALALELMFARKGENPGMKFAQYAAAQDAAKRRKMQEEQQAMQMKLQQQQLEQGGFQMEQTRRQQGIQDQLRQAAGAAFAPPQEAHGPMESGQGSPMLPGGGGMQDFAQRAMAIDPMVGMQYMPKPQAPKFHNVGGALVQEPTEPGGQARPVYEAPKEKQSPFGKINPADYTEASLRKFAASGNYADLVPYRAPKEGPAGTYDSARGVVVDPRTGQARPVMLPDGNPLMPKGSDKPEKPLTEGQAKSSLYLGMMQDAEAKVGTLKFDPTSMANQTMLAFARGDVPKIPKTIQNAAAGPLPQQYAQSTFQWTEAMLRQLTGAAAPDSEVWRQTKTYWPMPGDSKEVIAQKAEMRKKVSEYVGISAGPGAAKVDAVRGPQPQQDDPLGIRNK